MLGSMTKPSHAASICWLIASRRFCQEIVDDMFTVFGSIGNILKAIFRLISADIVSASRSRLCKIFWVPYGQQ